MTIEKYELKIKEKTFFQGINRMLLYGVECNMGNIFRLSHIFRLISRAFRQYNEK